MFRRLPCNSCCAPIFLSAKASLLVILAPLLMTFHNHSDYKSARLQGGAPHTWSMGYYTGCCTNQPHSSLDFNGLTHIAYEVVHPNADGSLQLDCLNVNSYGPCASESPFLTEATNLTSLAHSHDVKVLLGLGQGSWSSAIDTGSTFVNNVSRVMREVNADGVDLDWEDSIDYTRYHRLLVSLRIALGSKLLTATGSNNNNAFWAASASLIDRYGLQTYDNAGDNDYNTHSWFNSPLYPVTPLINGPHGPWTGRNVDGLVRSVLESGFPASKLNIGLPFYGYKETGTTGPLQPNTTHLSQIDYSTIVRTYPVQSASPTWNATTHTPWFRVNGGWITFDNPQSLTDKVNYTKNKGLGGWIIWNMSMDYLPSRSPNHPLMVAVASAKRKALP